MNQYSVQLESVHTCKKHWHFYKVKAYTAKHAKTIALNKPPVGEHQVVSVTKLHAIKRY